MAKIRVTADGSIRRWRTKPYSESNSPFESWDEYTAWNETRPCNNPACTKLRRARSKFCSMCGRYCMALGDPRYRPIKSKQYAEEIAMAKEVIDFNREHIVVKDFIDKFSDLASHGKQGLSIEYAKWWSCIYDGLHKSTHQHKVNPYRKLMELTAVYIFFERTGSDYIKGEPFWHYTLATITLRGITSKIKPNPTPKQIRHFGKYIWSSFSPYFIRLGRATMQNENLKRIRKQKLEEAEIQLPEEKHEKGEG